MSCVIFDRVQGRFIFRTAEPIRLVRQVGKTSHNLMPVSSPKTSHWTKSADCINLSVKHATTFGTTELSGANQITLAILTATIQSSFLNQVARVAELVGN